MFVNSDLFSVVDEFRVVAKHGYASEIFPEIEKSILYHLACLNTALSLIVLAQYLKQLLGKNIPPAPSLEICILDCGNAVFKTTFIYNWSRTQT